MELLDTFGQGLWFAAEMAWQTWWALVLGFTIAGAVEAFVSEERMTRALGGRGPRSVLLGTLFGAASSSCSFGAVATAKSLFKKGASAEASMGAFQFASTNLVIELGLVMWVLLGWQFVAANVVSGLILIALLVVTFRLVIPRAWFDQAREHVKKQEGLRDPRCGMDVDPDADDTVEHEIEGGTTLYFCSRSCRDTYVAQEGDSPSPAERLLTRRGWVAAFRNAIGEWVMLWKDIVLGFVVAGLIGAFVPREWWTAMFGVGEPGSLAWVAVSAVIGVAVGVVTFVCSVGNVPFALILWQNGIPFGAVMSFIFADLIVPPITDAYRRYYGLRMAATLFVTIAASAVVAGVSIHYLWKAIGWVPAAGQLGGTAPGGYTLYLNAAFTMLFAAQVWVKVAGRTGTTSWLR